MYHSTLGLRVINKVCSRSGGGEESAGCASEQRENNLKGWGGELSESQGQNLALTVSCVPHSLVGTQAWFGSGLAVTV